MNRLLIDTDVLIDYLRGEPSAVSFLESCQETLFVSAISVAELFAGVRGDDEHAALVTFLTAFEVVAVDAEIAATGGLYRRDFRKSHGTGLADALIAATAKQSDARMVTLNGKHFPMLDVLTPYAK